MRLLTRLLEPKTVAYAHCDLPCGVYDPAQARIEAESIKAIQRSTRRTTDPAFRTRALIIKEQRSELVKHHLWVLWTDYFKPPHFEKYPQLHTLFNEATKAGRRRRHQGHADPASGRPAAGQDRRDQQDLLGDQAGLTRWRYIADTPRRGCDMSRPAVFPGATPVLSSELTPADPSGPRDSGAGQARMPGTREQRPPTA